MADILDSTQFQAWCEEFDADRFAAFPTRLLSQLIEVLPPIEGIMPSSYGVLLVEPVVRKKDKAPFMRLRWRFSPEAVPLAKKLDGRFRSQWKAWDVPDEDGGAFDAVVAHFGHRFPWIVEMPSGRLALTADATPRTVEPAYGLLPEARWVDYATVLRVVNAFGGHPRGGVKILDVSEDGSCRFQALGGDCGVFTRHETVVMCVPQEDSSVLCVEWDVAATTPVRIVYGRASRSMLAMVGDAIDGLGQRVVLDARRVRTLPVVLRLFEGHLKDRHDIRVRLFDNRKPEAPSDAPDRPFLVEIDGARVEEAMASDDPEFEILAVVLATVEQATGLSCARR